MKYCLIFFVAILLEDMAFGQRVYTIQADSVKLTGCDSSELIIENHTQGVPGFLYNTGHGRTVFKHGAVQLNDSLYQIGGDTLKVPVPNLNFWSLAGNSNTDPSSNFIGTQDLNPLIFRTASAEHMRLFTDGNLGINTYGADNGYSLQVNGTVFAAGNAHLFGNLGITSGGDVGFTGSGNGFRIDATNGTSFFIEGSNQGTDMFTFTTGYGNILKTLNAADGSIIKMQSGFGMAEIDGLSGNTLSINPTYDMDPTSWPMTFRGIYYNPIVGNLVTGTKHIAIETVVGDVLLGTSSGNTGIGTNSPTAQFHTTGTVRFAGLTSDTTQTRVLVSDTSGNLYYRSASSLAMGNILQSDMAGGATLKSSLAVNGEITAQKLRLRQPDWPDYVFAKGYRLPSLQELKQYIQQNNHLPGVLSAADIAAQGIDVGKTQAILLKKIEELTLYIIAQDEKLTTQAKNTEVVEKLQEKISLQSEEIATLKEDIETLKTLIKK